MDESYKKLTVMAVGGLDPSGGAGILADVKTITAMGCYPVAVVTSLTLQNTRGVFGAYHQPGDVIRGQMGPLLDDFEVAAVKTGMLPTRDSVEAVAEAVSRNRISRLVVDPVVKSTSGFNLMEDGLDALVRVLFPLASIVTPNAAEAALITGLRVEDLSAMERAAESIFKMGPRAVLIKGGDLGGDTATDVLFDSSGPLAVRERRIESKNTHGTGCALASALACLLARGFPVREAVSVAKRYIAAAIKAAPGLGHGYGPLNHFPEGFKPE